MVSTFVGLLLVLGSAISAVPRPASASCDLLEGVVHEFVAEGLRPPEVPVEELRATQQSLSNASSHIRDPNPLARAGKTYAKGKVGVISANGGSTPPLNATTGVILEPMPVPAGQPALAPIAQVEVLNDDGSVYRKLTWSKNSGPVVPIDIDPPRRMRIVRSDRSSIEWSGGKEPPPGYRFEIRANNTMRFSGFSGGHTRAAWNSILATYGDLIHVESSTTLTFRLPGQTHDISVTGVRYTFGPSGQRVSVLAQKSLFEGAHAEGDISALEAYAAPWVARALRIAPETERDIIVNLPVLDPAGNPTTIPFRVLREISGPDAGKIGTWYIRL